MLVRNPKPGSLTKFQDDEITFVEYGKFTETTDVGTSAQDVIKPGWLYYLIGLNEEVGELTGKVKKVFRDNGGIIDGPTHNAIIQECGDILWYLARLASALGFSLASVAAHNVIKLSDRLKRNKIHGSGDNR